MKRVTGFCACALFLVWRASEYAAFWSKTLWALETALYGVLVFSYVTRLPAISPARGWRELVAPYLIAALPFAVFVLPVNREALPRTFIAGQLLLLVGTVITVVGMATLGRSFSISVEARAPVTSGLYRYIRHPVYAGEMISVVGVALIRLSWISVALTAAFWALQARRAGWEEQKLVRTFASYAAYQARTGAFFPRLR